MKRFHFQLKPVAPFRLDLTVWALRRRADNLVDRWDGKVYRRLLYLDGRAIDVAVAEAGCPDEPELRIEAVSSVFSPEIKSSLAGMVERILGTRRNLSGFYLLAEKDSQLAQLAWRFRGLKPPRFPDLFEALVNGIACQQISLSMGILLLNRLAINYGTVARESAPAYAFPQPHHMAGLESGNLQRLGFSHNKAHAIIELARMIADGHLNLEELEALDDEAALERLCRLRGVGRWTAEYALLRGLGRMHIFPGDDVGARNKLAHWLKLKEPLNYEDVRSILSQWEPYGGLIYFHLLLSHLAEEGYI